jgi:hypothetical protein
MYSMIYVLDTLYAKCAIVLYNVNEPGKSAPATRWVALAKAVFCRVGMVGTVGTPNMQVISMSYTFEGCPPGAHPGGIGWAPLGAPVTGHDPQ